MKLTAVFCAFFCMVSALHSQTNVTTVSNLQQPTQGDYEGITSTQTGAVSFTTGSLQTMLYGVVLGLGGGAPNSGTLGISMWPCTTTPEVLQELSWVIC